MREERIKDKLPGKSTKEWRAMEKPHMALLRMGCATCEEGARKGCWEASCKHKAERRGVEKWWERSQRNKIANF